MSRFFGKERTADIVVCRTWRVASGRVGNGGRVAGVRLDVGMGMGMGMGVGMGRSDASVKLALAAYGITHCCVCHESC